MNMKIYKQFVFYVAIGLALNAALYSAYLLLTYFGMPSLVAMSLTYVFGVLSGFVLNRRITFRYDSKDFSALLRYIVAYAIGYAINFVLLWALSVRGGLPHQLVQGGITMGLPVVLFVMQKFWVFRQQPYGNASLAMRSVP